MCRTSPRSPLQQFPDRCLGVALVLAPLRPDRSCSGRSVSLVLPDWSVSSWEMLGPSTVSSATVQRQHHRLFQRASSLCGPSLPDLYMEGINADPELVKQSSSPHGLRRSTPNGIFQPLTIDRSPCESRHLTPVSVRLSPSTTPICKCGMSWRGLIWTKIQSYEKVQTALSNITNNRSC